MMLVSPTEPPWLRARGRTHPFPESCGTDIVLLPHLIGIQRKDFTDLLSSMADGRLADQVIRMRTSALHHRVLILEGMGRFTLDGTLLDRYRKVTRSQIIGQILSIQAEGIWIIPTAGQTETLAVIDDIARWFSKRSHDSLSRRPGPVTYSSRGRRDERAAWILQGIDGLGPKLARRVVELYGLPLEWTISPAELAKVSGIGKRKADKFYRAITQEPA